MAFAVLTDQGGRLGIGQVDNALLAAEVELHPDSLISCVYEREGMAPEAMHVAITLRNAAIAHHDCHLMQGFRQQGPEVPVVVGAAQTGARIALDSMVQIREAQRVTEEEDRRVVADKVPVTLLGVELYRESTDIALGIGGATLARHRREPQEHRRFLAN